MPDDVDVKFISDFRKMINLFPKMKFVVVCGGGVTARKYIRAIEKFGASTKEQSLVGIDMTRFHAEFLARIFGAEANPPENLPMNMKKVKRLLRRNRVVFCGALRWADDKTSDGTASELASYLKCPFINLTNVDGLYDKNPKKYKGAKKISRITWRKFNAIAQKIKFHAGQNFVLDQDAAETIMKNRVSTYIVGGLSEMKKIIEGKSFSGTIIEG